MFSEQKNNIYHLFEVRFNTSQMKWSQSDRVTDVTNAIKNIIIGEQLAADMVLPTELEFSKIYQVSRTVIREAMRNLRTQGLIRITQGRPPMVGLNSTDIAAGSVLTLFQRSNASLTELLEFRLPLETAIASLAARRATSQDIEQLEKCIDRLSQNSNKEECIQADIAFHRHLAQASKNRIFILIWDTVSEILKTWQMERFNVTHVASTAQSHRHILQAVKNRDEMQSKQAMAEHLQALVQDSTQS
jgi:GntR family transcriptional regulator, transcriptional repressor for pyruvate dehydrogenase complex